MRPNLNTSTGYLAKKMLDARISELEAIAKRYQWLCDRFQVVDIKMSGVKRFEMRQVYRDVLTGLTIDDAIDNVIEAEKRRINT
jgi:hypothetical protein